MAEYQNTPVSSGEMAQRFIEFVMMQAQNAAFMLGQIPHPQTGKAEVNLDMAQLLIDQLVMIQEKTKGNLTNDEGRILANALANLQIAFVEVAQKQRLGGSVSPAPEPVIPSKPDVESPAAGAGETTGPGTEGDGKRKFVKSYGS
jgi:Domain of unknown function (DUF1844)